MKHVDQYKQQISFAYVRAVAAATGLAVDERSVDVDSVDLQVSSTSKRGTVKSPKLELQAKCFGDGLFQGDEFGYPLKLKNYDDLREPDVMVPRILVVVRVPKDETQWLGGGDDGLLLRHCGYWCSIRGRADYEGNAEPGNERVTVRLPRIQRFDVPGLRAMMDRISRGKDHWP